MNTRLLNVSNMNRKISQWYEKKTGMLGEMWVEEVD
jgi:hypothetical protein